MEPKFGQLLKTKHARYFALGMVVTNNPQLILDNVNYIGKKFCDPYQIWRRDYPKGTIVGKGEWS